MDRVIVWRPDNYPGDLSMLPAIASFRAQQSIQTETHLISFDGRFAVKKYASDEHERALRCLYVGSRIGAPGVECHALLSSDATFCLFMKQLTGREQQSVAEELSNGLDSLRLFHQAAAAMSDSGGFTITIGISGVRAEPYAPEFQYIDYSAELEQRALTRRPSDQFDRFNALPNSLQQQLSAFYAVLPRSSAQQIIHGDAQLHNLVGNVFIDYDHVRRGCTAYDYGRMLASQVQVPFTSALSRWMLTSSGIPEGELVRNYLHHCITFSAQMYGSGRRQLAAAYLTNAICSASHLRDSALCGLLKAMMRFVES